MASNYASGLTGPSMSIVRTAIGILAELLTPYRNDVIIQRKLFGFLSISITIGEVLDWLITTFGTASSTPISPLSGTSAPGLGGAGTGG